MKLKEICLLNPKPEHIDDSLPVSFVPMAKVGERGEFDPSEIKTYQEVKKGFTYFENGDVLFAKITPCMENGKGAIARGMKNGRGFGSTEFHVLRPNPKLATSKWLFYLLSWTPFRKEAEQNMTGSAGQKRVPKQFLEEYSCKLPSLPEQKNITDLFDRAQSIITLRQEQLRVLEELVKLRFVEEFGIIGQNRKDWPIAKIRDVVREVRYGTSRPAVEGGKYPYLRMNNITYDGELDLSEIKYIDIPEEELEKCTVRKGDVLFNRTNSKELVGKTCVYDREEPMVLAGFVIRVRVNERMLPDFLSEFMNTSFMKATLLGMCKTAIGQANINAQELQDIEIYVPPIELQTQFSVFRNKVNNLKFVVQKSIDETQLLFDSLMQKYFS